MKTKLTLILCVVLALCLVAGCGEAKEAPAAKITGVYLSPASYEYNNMRPDYNFYLLSYAQSEVTLYDNNTYEIPMELLRKYPALGLVVLIGSVRDRDRLDAIFEQYHPQYVFHAAAHKHVPLMENSPNEAIKNNVFGTLNVARAADKYHAKRMLLISTDKAVNPTNVMGASKRICEMIVQTMNHHSETE